MCKSFIVEGDIEAAQRAKRVSGLAFCSLYNDIAPPAATKLASSASLPSDKMMFLTSHPYGGRLNAHPP